MDFPAPIYHCCLTFKSSPPVREVGRADPIYSAAAASSCHLFPLFCGCQCDWYVGRGFPRPLCRLLGYCLQTWSALWASVFQDLMQTGCRLLLLASLLLEAFPQFFHKCTKELQWSFPDFPERKRLRRWAIKAFLMNSWWANNNQVYINHKQTLAVMLVILSGHITSFQNIELSKYKLK